jgi:hypothetical protein
MDLLAGEEFVDLGAGRHGCQITATSGDQGADCGTLINSFLQAATGKESREISGSESVSGANGVDRSDGKPA